MEKKLDGNYTRMLQAILNKSWRYHPTKQQLYGHFPPITKTIKVRRTRHAEHCWRSKNEHISDVLPWTSSHRRVKAGWPARTYIQLCADTGCSPEDLPEEMDDREVWRERVRDIRAISVTWWWFIYKSYSKVKLVTVVEGTWRFLFQQLLHRGAGRALLLSLYCSALPLIHTL